MRVLFFLLQRQRFGFLARLASLPFVGQQHLRDALVRKVRTTRRSWILPRCRALRVERLVGQRAALSVGLCALLGQTTGDKFGQYGREKLAEDRRFQTEEGADMVFGKGVQLLQVHASIFGRTEADFYCAGHL